MLDHCCDHRGFKSIHALSNVTVKVLPFSKRLHKKMEAGIIASITMWFQSFDMERAHDLFEENVKNNYCVDVLTAMMVVKCLWKKLQSIMIKKC